MSSAKRFEFEIFCFRETRALQHECKQQTKRMLYLFVHVTVVSISVNFLCTSWRCLFIVRVWKRNTGDTIQGEIKKLRESIQIGIEFLSRFNFSSFTWFGILLFFYLYIVRKLKFVKYRTRGTEFLTGRTPKWS